MRNTISKFITAICEKNYSLADSLLKEILTEKIKAKVKVIAEEKKYCCAECKRKKKNNSCGCDKNDETVSKKSK